VDVPLSFQYEFCSGCKVCQLVCALNNFSVTNPARALLNVYGKFPLPGKYYVDYCDQCGECANICPAEAIPEENGVYAVDSSLCTSCGLCEETCPKKVIRIFDGSAHKCTDCGECAKLCPRGAITRADG